MCLHVNRKEHMAREVVIVTYTTNGNISELVLERDVVTTGH